MTDSNQDKPKKTTRSRARLIRYSAMIIIVLLLIGLSHRSHAQGATSASPTTLIQNTSDTVIAKLRAQPDIANHPQAAYEIINQYVGPYMDSTGMARTVLGRTHWQSASDTQKKRFTKAFNITVMQTYAVALSQYTNETVKVLPLHADPNASRVLVKTQVLGNGPPLSVNYRLVQKQDSWKVYDFDVEGVSMLRSFRSQFDAQLAKNNSLDALIDSLEQHNRQLS